jgi:hypothetical protein
MPFSIVHDCISAGVSVGVSVGVKVGVAVGVSVGVKVGVAVGVSVGVVVGVSVGVKVGVAVGVSVGVVVGVAVGVAVGVVVGVSVGVAVIVGVGVTVGEGSPIHSSTIGTVIKFEQVPTDVTVITVAFSSTVTETPERSWLFVRVEGDTEPTSAVNWKFGPRSVPKFEICKKICIDFMYI